jgi:Tfp pilus assembly protein PilF
MINKTGLSLLLLALVFGCTKNSKNSSNGESAIPAADKLIDLQQNLEKAPSYENHIALGMELANRNRLNEAVWAYEKALQINPQAPIAYNNICAAFNVMGRHADALENCEKALNLEPHFALAKNNHQIAKEKFSKFRNELLAKKPELLKNAKTSEDHLNIGMQLFLARDLETANQVWRKIPSSDPFYPSALNNLASSQILQGKFDEAEKSLNKALSLQPTNQLFTNNKRWLEAKKLAK